MALESKFQRELKEQLFEMFPGCYIFKQDEHQLQGIPDLLILWRNKWAMLEVKRSYADFMNPGPNQPYYVDEFNRMSFAAFIYPENREEVLRALQQAFGSRR